MDFDAVIPQNGHEVVDENGDNDQLLLCGEDESILNNADKVSDIAALSGSLGIVNLEGHDIDNKSSHDGSEIPQVDNWPYFWSLRWDILCWI